MLFVLTAYGEPLAFLGVLAGSWVARKWLHLGWWRACAPLFGMRVVAVKHGSGRPDEVRIAGDRLIVRGAVALGASVDVVPRAEATGRVRVWSGFALELAVFAALAAAGVAGLPDAWGVAVALGIGLGAVEVFMPYGLSATPGWFLFVMPFAGREEFSQLARSAGEVRVRQLLDVGDLAAARTALGALDPASGAACVFALELLVHEGRYEEAGELYARVGGSLPPGPDQALAAQHFLRAACYWLEAFVRRPKAAAPPPVPSWLERAALDTAAALGLRLRPAQPSTDAIAAYLLAYGPVAGTATMADRVALQARSRLVAAHALCTAAIAYSLEGKREPAERAVREAEKLGQSLPRVAFALAAVRATFGEAADSVPKPDDGSAPLSHDNYHAKYGTEEDAWRW
ncbi:hypothetical protein LZ495_16365 [Yinghuangia sp. KLBMP8922]|uniref:Uncharacterized protein n=1 Tax=Yinghuangia soli TaxID=2908204 RepID=A0AA41TZF9_9ACTN|nr:hypothetical protein [Yinghuangia soli]